MEVLKIEDLQVHRLAHEHRLMNELEFEALKNSIQDDGQIVDIILYKGKIVDGRHRVRALIELGEETVKVSNLPGNISLAEVRSKVMSTEMRRADNAMQKAIRGYKDIINGNGLTQSETAVKFGVSRDKISQAKKLHAKLGIEFLEDLYHAGYVMLGDRRLTQLRDIIKHYEIKPVKPRDYEAPTERLANIYTLLKEIAENGGMEELLLASHKANSLANSLKD